ncbi:MAG: SDR family oxidoreductase [Burkholderiales bacterium]|nr:SDR family oxidoreductase [Bacteroidia bacterium]
MNVIITGASRGIGFELVKQFLNAGDTVFCLTRNLEPLKNISVINLKLISTDLSSQVDIDDALKIIKSEVKHIDCIINNAGSLVNKPYEDISYNDLEKVYKVNVFAPYYLTQQLLSILGKEAKSHIVNISSIGGFQGSVKFPGLSAYSSSKAAIVGLTECLAEELKDKNISVNCLAIGAVQTEMLAEAFPGYQAPLSPLQMAEYIFDFAKKGQLYYNGKILPVSSSTP